MSKFEKFQNLLDNMMSEELFDAMQKLKLLGLVQKIGVSVYSPYQIEVILNKFKIDLIQLPLNIVDHKSGRVSDEKEN